MLITYTLRWMKRHYIVSIIIGLAVLLILCLTAQMILSSYDVFPEKKRAEELAREQISEKLKKSGYTLIDLEIHSSEAKNSPHLMRIFTDILITSTETYLLRMQMAQNTETICTI